MKKSIIKQRYLKNLSPLCAASTGLLFSMSASAAGYYNFGMNWKGGLNPYSFGADGVALPSISDVKIDSSDNYYILGSNRILKFNAAGLFVGWIGAIATSPTGGAAGCNGAAVGTFTPGWCTGGSATSGTGDGMMDGPIGLAIDSSDNLYVSNSTSNRVTKYNSSTGAFLGWIGKIDTPPTGGSAGCNGAATGTITPGWCTGGTSDYNITDATGDGQLYTPSGLVTDSSGNLYVADSNGNRVVKFNSTGAFVGWTGGESSAPTGGAAGCTTLAAITPGWCTGGLPNVGGTPSGQLYTPSGIVRDSSGNLYVEDSYNRVFKYNSSGVYQGWIGKIQGSPTGGAAGCNGAATGTFTPGGCTGGTTNGTTPGTGDGMMRLPMAITVDTSDNLFVSDLGHDRVNKYNSSGVFQGWIGKIATSPTGGAAGCNGAAVGTLTPGWCTGGTSATGSGSGMFNGPRGLALDSSGYLYVADSGDNRLNIYDSAGAYSSTVSYTPAYSSWHRTTTTPVSGVQDGMLNLPMGVAKDSSGNIYVVDKSSNRINKYNSSGVSQGWIGEIDTSPTGGAAGCSGAASGTFTPGWCTGGTPNTLSTSTGGDGKMYTPFDMVVDSGGNLLVLDTGTSRVAKYDSTGAFIGWTGGVSLVPTGGAAGCTAATFNTPGWCTGGMSSSGFKDGTFYGPSSIALDSAGNFYVSEGFGNRISKFNSSGVFQGWIGKIGGSPTGGAAGCNGASAGTATPGWCTGGKGWTSGSGDGMFNQPNGMTLDSSGNLYAVDSANNRIVKYNSSGVFQGWSGKIGTSPTGGAAGCNGAAVGTVTPGWCKGGTAAAGTGDGMLNYPERITLDSAGNLYVTEDIRISKFNSSGVFQGWIGKIATSPTGGQAGCNGAAVGTLTPGWCTGGTAATGTGNGMLGSAMGIIVDSSGNLFVVDNTNSRVIRFSTQGR